MAAADKCQQVAVAAISPAESGGLDAERDALKSHVATAVNDAKSAAAAAVETAKRAAEARAVVDKKWAAQERVRVEEAKRQETKIEAGLAAEEVKVTCQYCCASRTTPVCTPAVHAASIHLHQRDVCSHK